MNAGLIPRAIGVGRRLGVQLAWAPVAARFRWHGRREAWNVFTHLTVEERLLLYRLGLQQPAGAVLVEIGSYLGASASFLAAAAREIGGGACLHCIDTWENQGMSEGGRDTWSEFQTNVRPYGSIIVPHRGRSAEIGTSFQQPIDLLFLDGDHSYEGCRADAEVWLSRVRPGGILVMHDYGWAEGVQRVVREIVRSKETERGHVLQNTYWTRL
jgi:predicted O-methyltransferase YrrM